ncbi:Cwf15/Cwc15 cell cycle control protein-domain-containing protein [Phakopsora pachyrhizi]|nr:Cwf15/Cwc15 cell cycle control protein-domain-containing protein [Phakopsora pachyrhizi]
MSSAHRPTWALAMGKDARMNTKQYSSRDIAAHTNLKFRKPDQNLRSDLSWRDLRLELELAGNRARALKHKQAGLLPLPEDKMKEGKEYFISASDSSWLIDSGIINNPNKLVKKRVQLAGEDGLKTLNLASGSGGMANIEVIAKRQKIDCKK